MEYFVIIDERNPTVYYYHEEVHMMLQLCWIRLWFIGMLTDWFLRVFFVHGDIEKLSRSLDHKWVFANFNVFYFILICATVGLD